MLKLDRKSLKHAQKRYQTYLLESEVSEQSIINKYGMPAVVQPPVLPEDIVERAIKATTLKREDWNRWYE